MSTTRSRPVIGVTGRRTVAHQLGAPSGFHDAPVDAYFGEYAVAVQAAGGLPVHLAFASEPAEAAEVVDGLLLTGGDDVDPTRYGRAVGALTTVVDPVRDEFELRLLAAVMDAGKPVLGICRGLQLVNVALGGTLVLDLPLGLGDSHASYAYPRAYRRHDVRTAAGSLARALYGETTQVNSFHHQAVDRPGDGVVVSGVAGDGVVEAVEVPGARVLGVQWHPECFTGDPAFGWLVEESRAQTHETAAPDTTEDAA